MKYIFNSPARVVVSGGIGIDPVLLASVTLLAVAGAAVAWFLVTFAVWLLIGALATAALTGLWIWVLYRHFTVVHFSPRAEAIVALRRAALEGETRRAALQSEAHPALSDGRRPVIVVMADEAQAIFRAARELQRGGDSGAA